jgi:hypothetical protein
VRAATSYEGAPPVWATVAEAWRVVRYRPHLERTLLTTIIVGTILFTINQLDVVMDGRATSAVWAKGALTYVVPFVVSNVGILIATRRPDGRG